MLLEQLSKFTHEETETLGDFAKNTKLVIVTPQKGDQEWISCHAFWSTPCPCIISHLNPLCPLNVLRVTMLKHCIVLSSNLKE